MSIFDIFGSQQDDMLSEQWGWGDDLGYEWDSMDFGFGSETQSQDDMLSEQWGWSDDVGSVWDEVGDGFFGFLDGAISTAQNWNQYKTFGDAQTAQDRTLYYAELDQNPNVKPVSFKPKSQQGSNNNNMIMLALIMVGVLVVTR